MPWSPAQFAAYIEQGACSIVQPDVARIGGITPWLKVAHLAEAFNLQYEIHHGGNSLNNVANLHLTMAIPNCDYFEVLLPDDEHWPSVLGGLLLDNSAWDRITDVVGAADFYRADHRTIAGSDRRRCRWPPDSIRSEPLSRGPSGAGRA